MQENIKGSIEDVMTARFGGASVDDAERPGHDGS
jgi:hypothetical protein